MFGCIAFHCLLVLVVPAIAAATARVA